MIQSCCSNTLTIQSLFCLYDCKCTWVYFQKMDSNNKQRLRSLHLQLGNLLTQRKALNSKVTTRHFELFREAVEAVSKCFISYSVYMSDSSNPNFHM